MAVTVLTSATFEEEVLKEEKVVLVDFYADWCGPCKMMAPTLEEIADEQSDVLKVCKINVDDAPDVARAYRVMSIPNMVLFKDGKAVNRFVGVTDKSDIVEAVKEL